MGGIYELNFYTPNCLMNALYFINSNLTYEIKIFGHKKIQTNIRPSIK